MSFKKFASSLAAFLKIAKVTLKISTEQNLPI